MIPSNRLWLLRFSVGVLLISGGFASGQTIVDMPPVRIDPHPVEIPLKFDPIKIDPIKIDPIKIDPPLVGIRLQPSLPSLPRAYQLPSQTGAGSGGGSSGNGGGSWGNGRGNDSGSSPSSDSSKNDENYDASRSTVQSSGGGDDCTEEHPCEEPEHHGPETEIPDGCSNDYHYNGTTVAKDCDRSSDTPEVKLETTSGSGSPETSTTHNSDSHLREVQTNVPPHPESNDDTGAVMLAVLGSFIVFGGLARFMGKPS